MITHHPDARLLNEFAAGTLPLAQSAAISVHLHFCSHCKRQVNAMQEMGAEMFDAYVQFKREEWIAHRDFAPIEPLDDDCLVELARENSAAAE